MMVDTKDIQLLAAKLNKVQVKYAVLNTLNDIAMLADTAQRKALDREFILRNRYTLGSLRVTKARLSNLQSEAGSIQGYLAKQDSGGTKVGKGGSGANVPTNFASNLPEGGERDKPVVFGKRLNNLKSFARQLAPPANTSKSSPRKQASAMARRILKATGKKYIYSDQLGKTGIYALGKGEDWLKLVHDMSKKVITVRKTSWHPEAIATLRLPQHEVFYRRLEEQFKNAKK